MTEKQQLFLDFKMIEIGDTLTIDHQIIGCDGRIIFEPDDKVVVRDLWIQKAHWLRTCPDIWIPDKLLGVMLVDFYGIWKPEAFKELKND